MKTTALKALLCAGLLGVVLGSVPAQAKTVNLLVHSGEEIDGVGSSGGYNLIGRPGRIGIHQADGHVIAFDNGFWEYEPGTSTQGVVSQFTGSGTPAPFSALGSNLIFGMLPGNDGEMAIDNSGGPNDGRIYTRTEKSGIRAFEPSGLQIGGGFPLNIPGNVCGIAVDPQGDLWAVNFNSQSLVEYGPGGSPTGKQITPGFSFCNISIDTAGSFYINPGIGPVSKFDSGGVFQYKIPVPSNQRVWTMAIDPSNDDAYLAYGGTINVFTAGGAPIMDFGSGATVYTVAVNGTNQDAYVVEGNPFDRRIEIYRRTGDLIVPDVTTGAADAATSSATLHGTVNADGIDTVECHFEWGADASYGGGMLPCVEGDVFSGSDDHSVSAELPVLTSGTTYHYRLVASNSNGFPSEGANKTFKPQGPPEISDVTVASVNTDNVTLGAQIDPAGSSTTYYVEIGTDTSYGTVLPVPDGQLSSVSEPERFKQVIGDTEATRLQPGTTYHVRVVATNSQGTTLGSDHTFNTFPSPDQGSDACPNSHERQQTGASLLADCRAYELVSAIDTGNYDVRSDLTGLDVLAARPRAIDSALYSLHFGRIPGIGGSPTNFGFDPYVSSRGAQGWSTKYVGLPADGTPAAEVFGSPLLGSDSSLSAFAFGGGSICSPCFADGSTGIPVRLPSGGLIQGMRGSLDPGPAAESEGYVGRALSDDGTHLVFATTSQFEPEANSNGDITIYLRDLVNGTTEVVSRTPGDGTTMTGDGIGALDVSSDGSRVIFGREVDEDTAGNIYWHPYLYDAVSGQSVDLAPTTTGGLLFNGMSADGSEAYFTTHDKLLGSDTDTSGDLYRMETSGSSVSISRVSSGTGAGDTDACTPAETQAGVAWNDLEGAETCDILAFAGGAGVASGGGTIYFLSPEELDGEGTEGEPNLFVARPGSSPKFVATLEPNNPAIGAALTNNDVKTFADIQVTPEGDVAIFASRLSLTGYPNAGHSEIYRYDSTIGHLQCASCSLTRATATGDVFLSRSGLNLTDDGRVFFTSPEQLVLRDTNGKRDAYQWSGGEIELVSPGTDPADSGLASISADGVNAYFFTRDTLVPEDENGTAMKLYVAREKGGFASSPPRVPCQASDECHGPGTQAPAPPRIGSYAGTGGNTKTKSQKKRCRQGTVRRGTKCVAKKSKQRRNRRSRSGR